VNTQVVLSGDALGEAKVVSESKNGPRYSQNTRRSFKPRFDYYAESFPSRNGAAGFPAPVWWSVIRRLRVWLSGKAELSACG